MFKVSKVSLALREAKAIRVFKDIKVSKGM